MGLRCGSRWVAIPRPLEAAELPLPLQRSSAKPLQMIESVFPESSATGSGDLPTTSRHGQRPVWQKIPPDQHIFPQCRRAG